MSPLDLKHLALTDVALRLPERFERIRPVASDLPVFTEAAIAALGRGETAESEDHRKWRTLPAWLNEVGSDLSKATVLCRRTALTVTVNARVPPDLPADVQLLPLAEEPKANLEWTTPAGEVFRQALAAMLDLGGRKLTLLLKFEDDQAGRELYAKMVETISAPNLKPTAVVSSVHTYVRHVPASTPGPVMDPRIRVRPNRDFTVARHETVLDASHLHVAPAVRPQDTHVARITLDAAAAAAPATPAVAQPMRPIAADLTRVAIDPAVMMRVAGRVRGPLIYTLPEAQTNASLTSQARLPLHRRREDTSAFPDLPRQARNGWDQVPNRAATQPPLHFRDSDQIASFLYLPTRFKLGYGVDEENAGRPPMRAEAYRDEQGNPKVKVTLVALPFIEEADRELMRTYLRDTVLVSQVPFVRLSPAAGVEARFNPDFTSGAATEGTRLPASIQFTTLELAPEKWLIVQFTMEASDYPIFGAMLTKGLRGRVVLDTDGVSQSVPVSLELNDVLTDGVRVRQDAATPNDLAIENMLDLPTTLSSVRASLLDTGPLDLIFDAEEHSLLPQAHALPAKGTWSTQINATRISGWDTTIVAIGPVRVDGGTADDWLNAVNRDPSLQPQPFRVSVSLAVPSAGADRFELVQLRLFKAGDVAPRQEIRMLPGSAPVDLLVNMTLEELMGREGKATAFYIEYESLQKDGSLSMPQRMPVNLSERSMVLVALVEAPGCVYTVDYRDDAGAHRAEHDRAAAASLVERLRGEGRAWQIYARRPEAPPVTPPVAPPDPATNPATGNAVSIITNLLGPAFATGTLEHVFVVLKPDVQGGASTTLSFDRNQQEAQSWRPATGQIPPFKYQITYVYASGGTRKVEGTETNLLLLLDPPPAP